jgi:hypothetical protein
MSATRSPNVDARHRRAPACACVLGIALVISVGCDRSGSTKRSGGSSASLATTQPAVLPQYRFADPTLETKFPDAAAFVREFLESCLAGDYPAYRKLVSRYEDPQRREQFDKLCGNLKRIEVESITELGEAEIRNVPRPVGVNLPAPAYLVVSAIEFVNPEANVALRYRNRRLAILVFREEGAWRMRPAPSKMQPREPHPGAEDQSEDPPAESLPDYPWDRDGDS